MKSDMRNRIFVLLLALIAAVSCSYKTELTGKDVEIRFELDGLKGTQVKVTAIPAKDNCVYVFDVAAASALDSALAVNSEYEVMQNSLKELYKEYELFKKIFKEEGAAYMAEFEDFALYQGKVSKYQTGLTPETDYYVVGYCVNPFDRTPAGSLYKMKFKTTAISPEPSRLVLDYMVRDGKDCLYYYTKPTLDGEIDKEQYLVDIVSDTELSLFDNDVNAYARYMYGKIVEYGLIDLYLRSDISRNEIYDLVENEGYTIFGAPFNINNMNSIYKFHFIYKKGISTDTYTHDK